MFRNGVSRLATRAAAAAAPTTRALSTKARTFSTRASGWSNATTAVVGAAGFAAVGLSGCALADTLPHWGVAGTEKERTFIAVKPDGVNRQIVGDIIGRFERKGYKLVGLKMVHPTKKMAEEHYADLSARPFFPGLTDFFSSGPVVCMCWEGGDAIRQGRRLLGETDPKASLPGTIRGDYCISLGRNIIHGSDGPESAQHEIKMWFKPEEIASYRLDNFKWIYETDKNGKVRL